MSVPPLNLDKAVLKRPTPGIDSDEEAFTRYTMNTERLSNCTPASTTQIIAQVDLGKSLLGQNSEKLTCIAGRVI